MPYSPPVHGAQRTKGNRDAQQREYNRTKRTGQQFYKTMAWKRLRASYAKANPICEECREDGRSTVLDVVDHKVEIKQGGDPLSWDNLRSLCHLHHNRKTARERLGNYIVSGCTDIGMPIGNTHHWNMG